MGLPTPITLRCGSCDVDLVLTPPLDEERASKDIRAFTDAHDAHRADVTVVQLPDSDSAVPIELPLKVPLPLQRYADPADALDLTRPLVVES